MEDRRRRRMSLYKNNKKNADEMRKKRSEKLFDDRKMRRAEEALLRRNVAELPIVSSKPKDLKVKLEQWKSEKLEKERLSKLKARPPFVTGKVKHKVGSPFFYKVEVPVTDQRVTRATKKKEDHDDGVDKRIVARNFKFKAPAGIVPIPLSYPSAKGRAVCNNKLPAENSVKKIIDKGQRQLPEKGKKKRDKVFSEAKETPKVTRLKIKDGKATEIEPSVDEKQPSLETIIQATVASLNIEDEVIGRDVKSFRIELDTEIASLQSLCEQWTELKDNNNLPEHVNDMIDLTVGQTKLLISKKLVQYRGLIDECEAGSDKVTCSDLQGFWDMVYMQVKDVNSRFEKLQCLKDNNWMELNVKEKPFVKKKTIIPKKPVFKASTAKSSIRGFIAAARNKSTKTVSTTPGRQNTPQKRKSEGVKAAFTPKSQSEKENKFKPKTPAEIRRISQVLMKISSQAKEVGTPNSQNKNNTPFVDVGDLKKPRSVKFSGKEVQLNGDPPSVSKVKVATPFISHKLNDLEDKSAKTEENDYKIKDTPKRAYSLRRSARLNN